uniref:Helicase ATP-binding domain-containing protein n=1 Tax=Macrostomum lignano TaxID=282301 RepID=A0A1I8FAQ7_9PLAT
MTSTTSLKKAGDLDCEKTKKVVADNDDDGEDAFEREEQLSPTCANADAFSKRVLERKPRSHQARLASPVQPGPPPRRPLMRRAASSAALSDFDKKCQLRRVANQIASVLDEDALFDEEELIVSASGIRSDSQAADLCRWPKPTLPLVKSRRSISTLFHPKDRQIEDRYLEDEHEKGPHGEQKAGETEHLAAATFSVGARDARKVAKAKDDDEYWRLSAGRREIDFVRALLCAGSQDHRMRTVREASLTEPRGRRSGRLTLQETRQSLPVYPFRERSVLIIEGETGSGNTYTRPAIVATVKKIGCTQPRRRSAMSVAARVAQEMGVKLRQRGWLQHPIRGLHQRSNRGQVHDRRMLLREFLTEPDLGSYSVMIIDEAHERTLHTDVLFGLVKDIARDSVPSSKLLISSATLDAEKFSTFFDDANIFRIPGRRYNVDIYYTKAPEADYVDAAVVSVLQIHLTQPLPGDILVFLTGQEEIETAEEILKEKLDDFGKVVIGTNIAETSLTITALCEVVQRPHGMESLLVQPISKAAQTAGAPAGAGRVRDGKCFRLYTAWTYKHELESQPSLGINDLLHFDFMDPPPNDTLANGRVAVRSHAIEKMILASEKYKCSDEIITIAAMLSEEFLQTKADHLTLLNVFNQWKLANYSVSMVLRKFYSARFDETGQRYSRSIEGLLERVEVDLVSCNSDSVPIRKAITAGFFYTHWPSLAGTATDCEASAHCAGVHGRSSEIDRAGVDEVAPHYYKAKDIDGGTRKMPKQTGKSQRRTLLGLFGLLRLVKGCAYLCNYEYK